MIYPVIKRPDESYIIIKNGCHPYHVPNNEEFAEAYAEITKWVKDNNIVLKVADTPEREAELIEQLRGGGYNLTHTLTSSGGNE